MEKLNERFLRYVRINTQSSEQSDTSPSTLCQWDLLRLLQDEMTEMGLEDVELDEHGYLMATIPATTDKDVPVIGFIAHVDTSPEFPGEGVCPREIPNYDGTDIILNKEQNIVMSTSVFPELTCYKGQDLIVTDGNTLLGSDDKAGIAEIMTAAEFLLKNKEIKHGKIRIAITPDEEIGRGMDRFDIRKFGAQYAYTVDGGALGELEYENFNAAVAIIDIKGRSVHPGYAKNKMINALNIAHKIHSILPDTQRPEQTDGREGFYHLNRMEGDVNSAKMTYLIREHDDELFERKKYYLKEICQFINSNYGKDLVFIDIKNQYRNMSKVIKNNFIVVQKAIDAMESLNIKPLVRPIRGGTDGARLSFIGLPCPNIFAGGVNFHGRYEFISINVMEKAKSVIIEIAKQWAK